MLKFPKKSPRKISQSKTKEEIEHLSKVAALGCIVDIPHDCCGRITLHHCGCYMGGGRDHRKVIPICWNMHLGPEGIDGKRMSKRQWEAKYHTEEYLLEIVRHRLAETSPLTKST